VLPPSQTNAIRARAQRAFVGRFMPGRRIEIDASHAIVQEQPEVVADEAERVTEAPSNG